MNKIKTLLDAIRIIDDGNILALGGNVLHRSPAMATMEIIRQGKKNLHIVKTAGAFDVDILCGAGSANIVSAGFISYETEYGLCDFYRKGVQGGTIEAKEHACYTVITALRASVYGVPFLPVRGLVGSDLIKVRGFKWCKDPYSGEELIAVQAIRPDVAIIHVQEADELGNARITGPLYEDILMAKAARKVIITAEKIVPTSTFTDSDCKAQIPGFLVDSVVHLSQGAAPGSCSGLYDIDRKALDTFKTCKTKEDIMAFVTSYEKGGNE